MDKNSNQQYFYKTKMKIIIRFATYQVEAELYDTDTARAIFQMLPIRENVNTWGDEIYFPISKDIPLESGATASVSVGDLAYWPRLPAFCIFFGPTPASKGNTPAAASEVNVFGRLTKVEPERLKKIPTGENVKILQPGQE